MEGKEASTETFGNVKREGRAEDDPPPDVGETRAKTASTGNELCEVTIGKSGQSSSLAFDGQTGYRRNTSESVASPSTLKSGAQRSSGSQFPSQLAVHDNNREDSFPFSRDNVPLAFGGLSKLPGLPLSPPRKMTDERKSLPALKPYPGRPSKADAGLQVYNNEEFSPGWVVQLRWYDDAEMKLDEAGAISDDEFIRRRRARKGKIRLFALFKTYPDYSMAVPIHAYSSEDFASADYCPEHHAIIYTGSRVPALQSKEKRPSNPPIRVQSSEELPPSSRLNYSRVFTIEHRFSLHFIGRIDESNWEAFATSYAKVQSAITGYDVGLPSDEPEEASGVRDPESPPTEEEIGSSLTEPEATAGPSAAVQFDYVDSGMPSAYTYSKPEPPYILTQSPNYMQWGAHPTAVQAFDAPSRPPSSASTASSSRERTNPSAHDEPTGGSSGGRLGTFGSEAPFHPIHARLNPPQSDQAEARQNISSAQKPAGPGILRNNEYDNIRRQLVAIQAFASQQQIAAERSLEWIQHMTELRDHIMNSIPRQPDQTLGSMFRKSNSTALRPSRVRVAILDTPINIFSSVFDVHRHRIRGVRDFIGTFDPNIEVTHGMHVASLLQHMAPECDVYLGRALGGDGKALAKAIVHAISQWQVDIISISGGQAAFDDDLDDALAFAHFKKVAVFAATHNHGKNIQVAFPARHNTVIGISSTNHQGTLSRSAARAIDDKANFATLGENIPAFWMKDKIYLVPKPISGSSYSTPLAVGIYANTIQFAKLSFRSDADAQLRRYLSSPAFKERLMRAISEFDPRSKYHYVNGDGLWEREAEHVEREIRYHIDRVIKSPSVV